MIILIAASDAGLAKIWSKHLERLGAITFAVQSQSDAVAFLRNNKVDVIVLDLMLSEGSAIAVADYTSYRWPRTKVVFVTNTTFFSDGSIFNHIPNAAAFLKEQTPPDDLAAIVEYHAKSG